MKNNWSITDPALSIAAMVTSNWHMQYIHHILAAAIAVFNIKQSLPGFLIRADNTSLYFC
jgi:hypothetical protein